MNRRQRIAAQVSICLLLCGCHLQDLRPVSDLERQRKAGVPDSADLVSMRPQIVHSEKMEVRDGAKFITVGNDSGTWALGCNQNQKTCITPVAGMDYFLFSKETKWKWPAATGSTSLALMQDWTGSYNNQENVALVPVSFDASKGWKMESEWGIYWVVSWTAKKK